MKSGVREIVGKTIAGVVVKESDGLPRRQVFLLLTDGTYFEFYGVLYGISGVRNGSLEAVRKYLTPPMQTVMEFVDETLLHRDDERVSGK
jgi:hypothetical protein